VIERVISGGQTGADRAGWRAAKAAGIPTAGAMPRRFLAEDGHHPEFAPEFGAHEPESADYPTRTEANVRASDGTLWFGAPDSSGGEHTIRVCEQIGKPCGLVPRPDNASQISHVVLWITDENIRILNVAGNRESLEPGIGTHVEAFLMRVFAITQAEGR
jgi:hypothetical protein